jgi:hypothetical protein
MTNHRTSLLADLFLACGIGVALAWTLFTNL